MFLKSKIIQFLYWDHLLPGSYKLVNDGNNFKRAVRPVLFEDRIIGVEQKFFCDRTTEKTITLTVNIIIAIGKCD